MTASLLIGFAVPIAATYLLLQPARQAGVARPLTLALAIGLGLGIASATYFLALLLCDGRLVGVLATDAALLVAGVLVWRRSGPSASMARSPWRTSDRVLVAGVLVWRRSGPSASMARSPWRTSDRVLAGAVVVAGAAAALSFLANTLDLPHGRWDAWATWNLRARQLVGAGPAWRTMFAKPTLHGDYPLLVPATVARLWAYSGDTTTLAPALVAAAYASALVLLLFSALDALRGRTTALVGALCLLGTPFLLRIAPWQYADVPLAFNLLASVTLLLLYDIDRARGGALLTWAGGALGLLAWTKNEGIVIAGIVVVTRAVRVLRRRSTPTARDAARFLGGLLPPALMVAYFKRVLGAPTPQLHRDRSAMLAQLLDLDRHLAVLRGAGWELLRGTFPLLLGLLAYAVLLGRTPDRRLRMAASSVAPILALAAVAYWLTYVTSRADITWYVSLSVDRLELQLWPTALLALLLYLASPAESTPAKPAAMRTPVRAETRRKRSRR